ncbi:hypothetical protein SODALDRAFT_336943 [Sodiomyces alkalinus F11]|uniref:Protein prenyltransferase n=1 Tax=Sodiomyces alkalinus (strain CBS 110278 / VKM F-3762 / F11) TaxID=1314773 RepID=A0A3N2QAE5_SODAK|nr:hypothetical protein SODALDRAFT_336943 [Sodiomyces alkalinus F11]ROT43721.1 hypothetical protein SODALDRAFT_336943 [Sodiomyces alkalinus F11]
MSRAVEKEVAASLKNGDQTHVFREISQVLTQHEGPELLEIEILGRSHPVPAEQVLLRDQNAVGVPKLRLIQAFVVARQILKRHAGRGLSTPEAAEGVNLATAVLLLMDAEHLTAANTRKRVLSSHLAAADDDAQGRLFYLEREKLLVDSLLTSRLHRHTKSPNLWSHRRWLMEQYRTSRLPVDVDVLAGMQVVTTSGERHPRNYYAWCHARWLVKTFRSDLDEAERRRLLWERVVSWCYAHHDDVSGWSFLDHLGVQGLAGDADAPLETFSRTLDLVAKLGRAWANESVWWYLRTTAARLPLSHTDRDAFRSVHQRLLALALGQDLSAGRDAVGVLETAWRWYEQNRVGVVGG